MRTRNDIDDQIVKAISDRLFPNDGSIHAQRMRSGGSTPVFRLDGADRTRYLRFAEDSESSLAPEAWVHDRLSALGTRVPKVLLFEEHPPEIARSIMVTEAVPGVALASLDGPDILRDDDLRRALYLAGQDLAQIHSIPVDGFGFVQRGATWNGALSAHYRSWRDWNRDLQLDLSGFEALLSRTEYTFLMTTIELNIAADEPIQAVLAHGDFDANHIFIDAGGYSGTIDFGEIRGSDRWFDLAHFRVVSSFEYGHSAFAGLIEGYSSAHPISDDDLIRIDERAIFIGCSILQRIRGRGLDIVERSLVRSIQALIDVHPDGFR